MNEREQALIRHPRLAIIDDEFIGRDVVGAVSFSVWKEERPAEGHRIFDMYPSNSLILTLTELEDYLLPPVSLATFTADRRGYNSRIKGNEAEWIRWANR